jgi:hypothetical protein
MKFSFLFKFGFLITLSLISSAYTEDVEAQNHSLKFKIETQGSADKKVAHLESANPSSSHTAKVIQTALFSSGTDLSHVTPSNPFSLTAATCSGTSILTCAKAVLSGKCCSDPTCGDYCPASSCEQVDGGPNICTGSGTVKSTLTNLECSCEFTNCKTAINDKCSGYVSCKNPLQTCPDHPTILINELSVLKMVMPIL